MQLSNAHNFLAGIPSVGPAPCPTGRNGVAVAAPVYDESSDCNDDCNDNCDCCDCGPGDR